jgi:Bacterial membrane protein YfhO
MLFRWAPVPILLLLVLIFFWPLVLHPDQTLHGSSSDLLAEHIPAKRFLVRSYQQTGELPLWCPLQFCGAPFVHDIQVALFYPPHLLLLALPEEQVGPALSWLIVAHLWLAGLLMFVYARHRGLHTLPALVAGIGFMFGPKWLFHLLGGGHYITIGLAWLPLVLLGLERAIVRNSLAWATVAGAAFALLILPTHPQWIVYAGVFTALWTLGEALRQAGYLGGEGATSCKRTFQALGRWTGHGLWVMTVAVALAAIQVLPTVEAARHSTRAAGMEPEYPGLGLRTFSLLVGPALSNKLPHRTWEEPAGFGLLWLVAAVFAPMMCNGQIRYQAGLLLALLLFAGFGALLAGHLPGLGIFRFHPRILVVAALPLAYLAGVTTQTLFLERGPSPALRQRLTRTALALAAGVVLIATGKVLTRLEKEVSFWFAAYWALVPVLFGGALWLVYRGPALSRRWTALLWAVLLLADLWAMTWHLVEVRPDEEVFRPSACVRYLIDRADQGHARVLDRYYLNPVTGWDGSPLGQGAPVALVHGLEVVRGYNPLDVRRFREYLLFLTGEDRPVQALDGAQTRPVVGSIQIKCEQLLDLLGVRYLLAPDSDPPTTDRWKRMEGSRDPQPVAYNLGADMQRFPPYSIFENGQALPRAFVVPQAMPLPPRDQVFETLKTTDFRRTVLLEGYEGCSGGPAGRFAPATLVSYEANRVVVRAETETPGFLVLSDVWYPGWSATVDGKPVPVYRANYVFRSVGVPAGTHKVVFQFDPLSLRLGKWITLGALAALVLLWPLLVLREWRRG